MLCSAYLFPYELVVQLGYHAVLGFHFLLEVGHELVGVVLRLEDFVLSCQAAQGGRRTTRRRLKSKMHSVLYVTTRVALRTSEYYVRGFRPDRVPSGEHCLPFWYSSSRANSNLVPSKMGVAWILPIRISLMAHMHRLRRGRHLSSYHLIRRMMRYS